MSSRTWLGSCWIAEAALALTALLAPTGAGATSAPAGWSIVTSDNISSTTNILSGVACASATVCWAVGHCADSNNYYQMLIEEWTATSGSWSVVTAPSTGIMANVLTGVACSSATQCWAVGYSTDDDSVDSTLIEGWDGSSWSTVPSPHSDTTPNELNGVTCAPAAECWAVGDSGPNDRDPTLIEEYPALPTSTPAATSTGVPVPDTGSSGGLLWPAGAVLAVGGVLLIGATVVWRRERRLGAGGDRSSP